MAMGTRKWMSVTAIDTKGFRLTRRLSQAILLRSGPICEQASDKLGKEESEVLYTQVFAQRDIDCCRMYH